jgi:hypothetical protein
MHYPRVTQKIQQTTSLVSIPMNLVIQNLEGVERIERLYQGKDPRGTDNNAALMDGAFTLNTERDYNI